jgi:hypothetical protein
VAEDRPFATRAAAAFAGSLLTIVATPFVLWAALGSVHPFIFFPYYFLVLLPATFLCAYIFPPAMEVYTRGAFHVPQVMSVHGTAVVLGLWVVTGCGFAWAARRVPAPQVVVYAMGVIAAVSVVTHYVILPAAGIEIVWPAFFDAPP